MEDNIIEYRERVLELIGKGAGRWITYHKKTPYLIDIMTSLSKLEKLIKEIK